jgi:osmotically-inducible protein OsmY
MKRFTLLFAAATLSATAFAQPGSEAGYLGSPTYVTAPRSAEDQAITDVVIQRIEADPLISGRVGVDTARNVVTLSGRVATTMQAERATRDAKSVRGVREVDNQLRSHPGA